MYLKKSLSKFFDLSTLLIILAVTLLFLTIHPLEVKSQEPVATFKIINPLTGNRTFIFGVEEYLINSTFTANFYIAPINGLVAWAWQFLLLYDSKVINITEPETGVWIPEANVFKGYELILVPPTVMIDDYGMANLRYGAFIMDINGVNVLNDTLLCQVNFTIMAHPGEGEDQISSNIEFINKIPTSASLDTCVYIASQGTRAQAVSTESVTIRIAAGEIEERHDICVKNITVDKPTAEVGDVVKITVTLLNLGNVNEEFNFSLSYDGNQLVNTTMVLNPNSNSTLDHFWNTTNLALKTYTILASVEPVPNEADTTNNQASIIVKVKERLTPFTYFLWLMGLWASTPLGILVIIYLVVVAGILLYTSVFRRLRR